MSEFHESEECDRSALQRRFSTSHLVRLRRCFRTIFPYGDGSSKTDFLCKNESETMSETYQKTAEESPLARGSIALLRFVEFGR